MGLTVRRTVAVQVVVTEKFKEELKAELEEAISTTEHRIEQMEFQSRRFLADLQRTDLTQAMGARRQIEAERRRQEATIQDLRKQAEEAEKLELGSEFPRGNLESLIEVKEGDDLFQKLSTSEIVIKDGIIVEVRES